MNFPSYIISYTGSSRKTWWLLCSNKIKSILSFLHEFTTKIIFISKHFNYNIHFLKIVKVATLVNTFPQAFLYVLHHLLQHGESKCCHFVPDVLFQVHRCPWFLFIPLALEISLEEEVLWLQTLIPMNIEVPTKYQLNHNDRIVVFVIFLHHKNPMLYKPALHGN
jgi:hypothetical protein